jgi:hypothetical protein
MFLAEMTSLQPRLAYLKASSLPIPYEAPVMTTTESARERNKQIRMVQRACERGLRVVASVGMLTLEFIAPGIHRERMVPHYGS